MADFSEAAEFVRRWVEKQRDVIALGEALQTIGRIDHAAKEHEEARDKLAIQVAAAKEELQKTTDAHKTFLATRAKDLKDHEAAARQILADAKAAGGEALDQARAGADATIASANAEAERMREANAQRMAELERAFAAKSAELSDMQQTLTAARQEHEALVETIANMRRLAGRVMAD
jgi:chromosome segregation ATPase